MAPSPGDQGRDLCDESLESGQWAPSHRDRQSWEPGAPDAPPMTTLPPPCPPSVQDDLPQEVRAQDSDLLLLHVQK